MLRSRVSATYRKRKDTVNTGSIPVSATMFSISYGECAVTRCDAQRASRVLPISAQPGCRQLRRHAQVRARPLRRSPGLVGRAASPRRGATWAKCTRTVAQPQRIPTRVDPDLVGRMTKSTAALGMACCAVAIARSMPIGTAPGAGMDCGGVPNAGRDECVSQYTARSPDSNPIRIPVRLTQLELIQQDRREVRDVSIKGAHTCATNPTVGDIGMRHGLERIPTHRQGTSGSALFGTSCSKWTKFFLTSVAVANCDSTRDPKENRIRPRPWLPKRVL
jgi:hypothetical protein